MQLKQPVVGMAATSDGKGYWLVASDGGIFTFGDAKFYGSTGALQLNKPIIGMAPTSDGQGYWLVASDGGVFTFGNATFYGSTGGGNVTVLGMLITPSTAGYELVESNGTAIVPPLQADLGWDRRFTSSRRLQQVRPTRGDSPRSMRQPGQPRRSPRIIFRPTVAGQPWTVQVEHSPG